MYFKQKFEPPAGKVIHGAGQSVEQFKKYWKVTKEVRPLIYMAYNRINDIEEKLPGKISKMLEIDDKLFLQLGLNLKPKDNNEKCKDILEGKFDKEINALIKILVEIKNPVFLRIGYECNNPAHNYQPVDFKEAWKYVVKKFRDKNVNNVAFVWSVCTAFNKNIDEVMDYYPGDKYVDWFADDLFGVKHFTEKNSLKIITESFCKEAKKHKKPLMIAESSPAKVGVDNGKESWDEWFEPFFRWIDCHPVIKAFCYINWDWGKDWKKPEWLNGRIEENSVVSEKYINELKKEKYLNNRQVDEESYLKK